MEQVSIFRSSPEAIVVAPEGGGGGGAAFLQFSAFTIKKVGQKHGDLVKVINNNRGCFSIKKFRKTILRITRNNDRGITG